MKLRYETGVATLTQFIVMGMLNLFYAIFTSVNSCVKDDGCGSDTLLAIIYFVLISLWFGFVAILGYAAQDKRSKRLSQLLIITEGMVALIALFNFKHYSDYFGLVISVIDVAFAIWVIVLAFRLMRSGGGRITTSPRARTRARARKPVSSS